MQEDFELAPIFLRHVQTSVILAGGMEQLEHLLRQAWDLGSAQWPEMPLPKETFVRHLTTRLLPSPEDPTVSVQEFLEQLVCGDFYLACACAHEIPGAIEAFEQHYLIKLPMMLAHLRQSAAQVEDICQLVRTKLLVRTSEALPKIAEYSGRGGLLGWLRITAVRTALSLMRTIKEKVDDTATACAALPSPGTDPELDLIKRNYHHEFRQAVSAAFATLSSEERHLLQLSVADQLTTGEIGLLLGVNQATISRRLKGIRQRIYEETKRLLRQDLGLSSGEFESLLRVVDSELDISISQILGPHEGEPQSVPSSESPEFSDPGDILSVPSQDGIVATRRIP